MKITWKKTERGYSCNQISGLNLIPTVGGRWKSEIGLAPQFSGLIFGTKGEATTFFERNFSRVVNTPAE